MKLPSVKTEPCDTCDSEKYLECPQCLIYGCECKFNWCDKCNNKHCFRNECGEVSYYKTNSEKSFDLFMEFEDRGYVSSRGKKIFHCKITVDKTKCKCGFECYPWMCHNYFARCSFCDSNFCGDCIKECHGCDAYFCENHEIKINSCKCNKCNCENFLCSNCPHKCDSCCEFCD